MDYIVTINSVQYEVFEHFEVPKYGVPRDNETIKKAVDLINYLYPCSHVIVKPSKVSYDVYLTAILILNYRKFLDIVETENIVKKHSHEFGPDIALLDIMKMIKKYFSDNTGTVCTLIRKHIEAKQISKNQMYKFYRHVEDELKAIQKKEKPIGTSKKIKVKNHQTNNGISNNIVKMDDRVIENIIKQAGDINNSGNGVYIFNIVINNIGGNATLQQQ